MAALVPWIQEASAALLKKAGVAPPGATPPAAPAPSTPAVPPSSALQTVQGFNGGQFVHPGKAGQALDVSSGGAAGTARAVGACVPARLPRRLAPRAPPSPHPPPRPPAPPPPLQLITGAQYSLRGTLEWAPKSQITGLGSVTLTSGVDAIAVAVKPGGKLSVTVNKKALKAGKRAALKGGKVAVSKAAVSGRGPCGRKRGTWRDRCVREPWPTARLLRAGRRSSLIPPPVSHASSPPYARPQAGKPLTIEVALPGLQLKIVQRWLPGGFAAEWVDVYAVLPTPPAARLTGMLGGTYVISINTAARGPLSAAFLGRP